MDVSILQSQVFFFVSSIGFVMLWVLTGVFLIYLIRATSTFSRIMEKLEKDIDNIGDTTKDILEEMKESVVFRFLFGKKRKQRNKD